MDTEVSVCSPQEPATCPSPLPDQSTPPFYFLQTHFDASVFQVGPFRQAAPANPCVHNCHIIKLQNSVAFLGLYRLPEVNMSAS
jgi:hypothetical protein